MVSSWLYMKQRKHVLYLQGQVEDGGSNYTNKKLAILIKIKGELKIENKNFKKSKIVTLLSKHIPSIHTAQTDYDRLP